VGEYYYDYTLVRYFHFTTYKKENLKKSISYESLQHNKTLIDFLDVGRTFFDITKKT